MIKGWLMVYTKTQCLIQTLLKEGSCLPSYYKANSMEAESRQVYKYVPVVLLSRF